MSETMVVGVDGTAESLEALNTVAQMVGESGATLVVVHVRHESALVATGVGVNSAGAMLEALDEMERLARENAAAVLAGRHLTWRFQVAVGDPATELIAAAHENHASTIVVGARSHGVVGGLIVGSVAQKLVRQSPVSILVVRDGHAERLGMTPSGR